MFTMCANLAARVLLTLTISPQHVRASHQRLYAVFVRKTSNQPSTSVNAA
jgi:hypothetical protein